MLDLLALFIILGAASYRVGRFIALDTLIEEPREKVFFWMGGKDGWVWRKATDLLTCPYCLTIWTSLAAALFYDFAIQRRWSGWWFPIEWMAVSTAAIGIWTAIDSDD